MIKEYFKQFNVALDDFCINLCTNMTAIKFHTAKLDDLAAWRLDLEKRVSKIGMAIAGLQ